ncbi:hypothetical protein [Niallia sp. 03133]|uniref:hypothetical protein n=1 Tax=Niallia sp. 03133 TaxID=3458060 RepID=UPI004043CD5E
MKQRKKGDIGMITVSLKDIANRAKINANVRKNSIETFNKEIQRKNMNQGRMRPRDPDEAKILSMFSRK